MQAAREVALDGSKPLKAQIKPALEQHSQIAQKVADTVPQLLPDADFQRAVAEIGARLRDNPALAAVPAIEKMRERLMNIEGLSGQQALDAIREFRASSKVNLQSLDDFTKHQAARAERAAADAFEGLIERSAAAAGSPELVDAFRKSRVRAAKLHDLESALIGDNVDLSVFKNIGSDNLTGRFQQLARVAEEFPALTKTQSRISAGSHTMTPSPWFPYRVAGRMLGRSQGDKILSENFQRQFGDVTPEMPEPRQFGPSTPDVPPVTPDPFTSEVLDMPPTERRVTPGADRGELERRAGILAERQAVLDRPVGTKPNAGLADEMLADPEFEAAVRGDTRSNRVVLNPAEADAPVPPPALADDLIEAPADASIQNAIKQLREFGFTPEEIAEILASGG
jgi:hypothetical protein